MALKHDRMGREWKDKSLRLSCTRCNGRTLDTLRSYTQAHLSHEPYTLKLRILDTEVIHTGTLKS